MPAVNSPLNSFSRVNAILVVLFDWSFSNGVVKFDNGGVVRLFQGAPSSSTVTLKFTYTIEPGVATIILLL